MIRQIRLAQQIFIQSFLAFKSDKIGWSTLVLTLTMVMQIKYTQVTRKTYEDDFKVYFHHL